jgi:hypothetical protein
VVVATARGDLDNDGVEDVVQLLSNGVLQVEGAPRSMARIAGFRAPDSSTLPDRAPHIAIVDIDRRDVYREVLVTRFVDDEDPPPIISFWALRERQLRSMLDRNSRGQEIVGSALQIPGDGTVAFARSQCVRDRDETSGAPGIREHVSYRYVLADGSYPRSDLVESVSRTRAPADCIESACPLVRIEASGRAVGEVLRNLRGAGSEAWQRLRLDSSDVDADGVLRIEVVELKREVTQLDAIHVVADGRRISAQSCARERTLPMCEDDASRLTLQRGDSLHLEFHVGRVEHLELWARGYYDPLGPSVDAHNPAPRAAVSAAARALAAGGAR